MHYPSSEANASEQKEQRIHLRHNLTPAEALLWRALKGRGAGGLKFRRQQGIGPFVLDFYCPEARLCVELDGSAHDHRCDYDERRTAYLAQQGIRVIRFTNDQVFTCLEGVVAQILRAAAPHPCRGGVPAGRGGDSNDKKNNCIYEERFCDAFNENDHGHCDVFLRRRKRVCAE